MSQKTQGFKYAVQLFPDIAILTILRLVDASSPVDNWHTVCITTIARNDANELIKWYDMEYRGVDYYMTKHKWQVPDHTINQTSGTGVIPNIPHPDITHSPIDKSDPDGGL